MLLGHRKKRLIKIANSRGIVDPPAELHPLITRLLRDILGVLAADDLRAIMALRGKQLVDPIPAIVPRELIDDGLTKDESKDFKDADVCVKPSSHLYNHCFVFSSYIIFLYVEVVEPMAQN